MRAARGGRAALAIFARHPAGRVKTRLVPPLTPAQAQAFHRACLASTARLAGSLPPAIDKWVFFTAGKDRRRPARAVLPPGFSVAVQQRGDLGRRLRVALGRLRRRGYRRVVFLGSDSPTLPGSLLRRAFAALKGADAVLGPARDGGYYLLGLRTDGERVPDVFRGIDWSSARTFRQTRARLRAAGCRTVILPLWYDVDWPADLERLRREVRAARRASLRPLKDWFAREAAGPSRRGISGRRGSAAKRA